MSSAPFEIQDCILHHLSKASQTSIYKLTDAEVDQLLPEIPPESVFTSLYQTWCATGSSDYNLPTIPKLAAHLELLEAFYILHKKVISSQALDYTFNTLPLIGQGRNDFEWLKRRKKKWKRFVQLAVVRFAVWNLCPKGGNKENGLPEVSGILPPLDVLMVLYAYMVGPYKSQRQAGGKIVMPRFPWGEIHMAIDHSTREYKMKEEHVRSWQNITSMPVDLFGFLEDYGGLHETTKTVLGLERSAGDWETDKYVFENHAESMKPGEKELITLYEAYVRRNLSYASPDSPNTPSSSRQRNIPFPMVGPNPGTRLDPKFVGSIIYIIHEDIFPFIHKMCNLLWIRSPYLSDTLSRCLVRYAEFFSLLKLQQEHQPLLIPTADIDLVWRTHALDASGYYNYCMGTVTRLVKRNPSVGDINAWEWTKDVYWRKFGRCYYGGCFCWVCEGVKSETEKLQEHRSLGNNISVEDIGRRVVEKVIRWRAVEKERRQRTQEVRAFE